MREQIVKGIQGGTIPVFKPDDVFKFKCTACGLCCFGIDVLLNPMDIYLMARSKLARNTFGVRWTNDLLEKGLVALSRGPDSGFPIATIAFKAAGPKGPTYCPFLVPKDPDKYGMNVIQGLNRAEVQETIRHGVKFECGLHEDGKKPAICRLSPLGRVFKGEDPKKLDIQYMWSPIAGCPGLGASHEWTVRDFLEKSGASDLAKYSTWFFKFVTENHKTAVAMTDSDAAKLGMILYDLDFVYAGIGRDAHKRVPQDVADGRVPSQMLDADAYFEMLKSLAEKFLAATAEAQAADKAAAEAKRAARTRNKEA